MNRITVTQIEGMKEAPKALVLSYTRTHQMTIIHTHVEQYEAESDEVMDGEGTTRFRCTCTSIVTDGRLDEMGYKQVVALLVESRYSKDDEMAAHRKAILGDTTEFEQLNAFVEDCKAEAKKVFASLTVEEEAKA